MIFQIKYYREQDLYVLASRYFLEGFMIRLPLRMYHLYMFRKISWHVEIISKSCFGTKKFSLFKAKYFIRGKIIHFETLDEKLSKNDTLCSSWPGERLYSVWFVFDSAFEKLNWQKKVTIWLLQWLSCLFWKVETIV